MSGFTKTLMVDARQGYGDYSTIKEAVEDQVIQNNGGVIIVEQGTYTIASENDIISVPSNVTIIGRGNAVIEITDNAPAFKNSAYVSGSNDHIIISGFKIIVKYGTEEQNEMYSNNVIDLKSVNNCLIEKLYITYTEEQNFTRGIYYNTAAISIWGDSNPYRFSRDNVIKQCSVVNFGKVYDDGGGGNDNYYGAGIILHTNCERIKINNNILKKTAGCYIHNEEGKVSNFITISNNVFSYGKQYDPDNTRGGGFGLCIGGQSHIITGNQMNHNESHGIYPSGGHRSTFHGNVFCSNEHTGIKSAWGPKYNTITGNVCNENSLNGIHLHGGIDRNYIGPSFNTIYGNSCCKNGSWGIHINEWSHNNNLVGNMCFHAFHLTAKCA